GVAFVRTVPHGGIMIGELRSVVLDAADIHGLAEFYQRLAGWKAIYVDDEWITLSTDDGWRVCLQVAPDHVPPRWPEPAHPQQAHLDLRVPDLEAGPPPAVDRRARPLRPDEA